MTPDDAPVPAPAPARWLLLVHQIPPKPDYLRVKIGRRLQRIGAAAVKNSVYVLPDTPEALEDLHWLRAEIVEGGGEAVVCRAEFLAGVDDDEIRARLAARPGRAAARATPQPLGRDDVRGSTWVTREGIFVDRIASAWLIGRFIDPEARFRFVPATGYRPRRGELRFDMYDAEFTHVGDRCTFEVLLERFALDDPALAAIAEVVHDIDMKDGKYGREDTPGIERVLHAIARANADDEARLARGRQLFDDLYALHSAEPP
jgi:hypothetical protein